MDPDDRQLKDAAAKIQRMSPEERQQFLDDNPEMAKRIEQFAQAIEDAGGMLTIIAQYTITTLTNEPEKREQLLDLMQRFVERAQAKDHQMMADFVEAITKLLQGDKVETLAPHLEGEYLAAWQQIRAALSEPDTQ